jgi:microcystin-dependent protein
MMMITQLYIITAALMMTSTLQNHFWQILTFAGGYVPQDWVLCDGRLLSINEYSAVFALIGTTYGGDGMKLLNYLKFQIFPTQRS